MVTCAVLAKVPGGRVACTRMPARVAILIGHVSFGRADHEITEGGGSIAMKRFDAGQAPCAGACTRGRALRSMCNARLESRVVCLHKEEPHPFNVGCGRWSKSLKRELGGVDNVHTLAPGLGRTAAGSGRIPHVSAGAQCLRGLGCSSSPTSGTVFPQVRGYLVFYC